MIGLAPAIRAQANARIIRAAHRDLDRVWESTRKPFSRCCLAGQTPISAFADIRGLLLALGFDERVRGDHHIFTRDGVEDIINLQPVGAKAKPYQVRQVRNAVLRYKMEL